MGKGAKRLQAGVDGRNSHQACISFTKKKLWDGTNHISGFRATGLHPLDPGPVLCKLTTSMPFHAPSSAPSTSDTSSMVTHSASPTTSSSVATASPPSLPPTVELRLEIKGACHNCGAQLTPMQPHLTLHFEKTAAEEKC